MSGEGNSPGGADDGGDGAGGRLVVVSNRVSVPDAKDRGSQGGLAVAMHATLRRRSGVWFGWSGKARERPGPPAFQEVDGVTLATIDLTPDDYDEYYNGYANRSLWPLFHNLMGQTAYDRLYDRGYFRVNVRFAHALAPLLRPDDLVWVHDFHLIACAEELRRMGLVHRIGFFLHIPFPPADLLVTLPSHASLVRGLFAYDLVGFQTEADLRAFRDYVVNEAGGAFHGDDRGGSLEAYGASLQAGVFPIGIDFDEFQALAVSREAARQEQRLRQSLAGRKMMIGVDRLDYTKGVENRFLAFERLLAHHPEHYRGLLLLQIAPPSRVEVPEYGVMRNGIEHVCGRVNGRFADVDWVPIRYVNRGYPRRTVGGLYRAADVGLVTPLKDGMNLVAKEFAAVQPEESPGVLVLSRFAGAACELGDGAVIVNPYDIAGMADAMQRALNMAVEERRERRACMIEALRRNTVAEWRDDFVAALRGAPRTQLG